MLTLPSWLFHRQYYILGGRDEVPISGISWCFKVKMTKGMTEQTKPVTLLENDVPADPSTPSWIIVPSPSLCCASLFCNDSLLKQYWYQSMSPALLSCRAVNISFCGYNACMLWLWAQAYVSVSAGLIIASTDSLRSCLAFPGDTSLYSLPLDTQPVCGLDCVTNGVRVILAFIYIYIYI